jgi:hypothetical protein
MSKEKNPALKHDPDGSISALANPERKKIPAILKGRERNSPPCPSP